MNFAKRLLHRLASWLRNKLRPIFHCDLVEDVPDKPRNKVNYIVTESNVPWSAAILCPCGCGVMLDLNLLDDTLPVWDYVNHHDHTVTLSPSVFRKVGCRSHFWFRESRVYWTPDQPDQLLRDIRLTLKRN